MRPFLCLLLTLAMGVPLTGCISTEGRPPQDMAEERPSVADGLDVEQDTVSTAVADPHQQQVLYLWDVGNVPAVTTYTENNANYFDDPDFRPYLVTFPVPEGTEAKGAVLVCAGGDGGQRGSAGLRWRGVPVPQR